MTTRAARHFHSHGLLNPDHHGDPLHRDLSPGDATEYSETGARGMGEGGTIGAPGAIANAVADALSHLRIEVDRLPITPDRLRAAIKESRAQGGVHL
jgi:CO/xanthine dehydrogenase Mo-binding subunit